MNDIRARIVRFAVESSGWGYCRIQGALKNVGHHVSPTTIANVLKQHGIQPSPDRSTSWRVFLKAHWGEHAATDFFTVEVWTPRGLRTYYVLFFLRLESRRVHIAGITTNPTDLFMGRAVEGSLGFLSGVRHMIHDRGTKYSLRFRIVLEAAGIATIRSPFQAPNANAYAERFVRSIKEECLGKMIFFGEQHLCHAIDQYLAHYHSERNHQGLGNELIEEPAAADEGEVISTERLGGLLRSSHRAA